MLKIANILLFALMVFMNYLANAIPLNGKTTGELSAQYPNLFVPAGITFSIWGAIYMLLLVFLIFQFTHSYSEIISKIGWLFTISCALNALWIVAWHYKMLPLSLVIMLGLLVTLIIIGVKLHPLPQALAKAIFGIYLGWICIATIANVTALLVSFGWLGFGFSEQVWAIIMIALATAIVLLTVYKIDNLFIGLAAAWALLGIAINRYGDYRIIAFVAIAGIVLIIIASAKVFWLSKN
jgi:hypothetical protein